MKKKTKIWLLISVFILIAIIPIVKYQMSKTEIQTNTTKMEQKTFVNEEIIKFFPDQEQLLFFLKKDYNCGDNIQVETNDCVVKTSNGWKNICSETKLTKMRC